MCKDFPGSPVVGTPLFHSRWYRLDPWSGKEDSMCIYIYIYNKSVYILIQPPIYIYNKTVYMLIQPPTTLGGTDLIPGQEKKTPCAYIYIYI